MNSEKPCGHNPGLLDTHGADEQEPRVSPFFGWASLGLSLGGPVVGGAIRLTGPHAGLDLLAVPLLAGPTALLGLLVGIFALRRREEPKYPAWVGIVGGAVHAGFVLCMLVYGISHMPPFEP